MVYLFYGKDTYRSLKKLNELIEYFKKNKNAGLSLFNIDEENFDVGYFESLMKSRHLFGNKNLVVLKRVFQNKMASKFILENIEKCKESDNVFIFYEEFLTKPILDVFAKNAKRIWEFNLLDKTRLINWIDRELRERNLAIDRGAKESLLLECGSNLWSLSNAIEKIFLSGIRRPLDDDCLTPDGFNVFRVVDAFSERRRRDAWILLQECLMRGMDAEEVFWKIFWQIKNLLLVKVLLEEHRRDRKININFSAAEFALKRKIKLHPFVLRKCLKAEKLFSWRELNEFSWELADIYQNSRCKNLELNEALEKFLLNI
jgi:DNA polymerase-3 subunit delta